MARGFLSAVLLAVASATTSMLRALQQTIAGAAATMKGIAYIAVADNMPNTTIHPCCHTFNHYIFHACMNPFMQ